MHTQIEKRGAEMKTVLTLIAVFVSSLLTGCATDQPQTGGGDDFPNMVAAAGASIVRNLDQSWENPASAPSDPLSLLGENPLPSIPTGILPGELPALAKQALLDSIRFFHDAVAGNTSFFIYRSTDTTVSRDTIVAKLRESDTLILLLAGEITRSIEPAVKIYYRYSDFDGDSILFDPAASRQQALGYYRRSLQGNLIESGTLAVDAGEDGKFDTEGDNRTIAASALVTVADDTVSLLEMTDADGDGFVLNRAATADSGMVDITTLAGRQNSASHLLRHWVSARVVIFHDDSAKNYAIRYGVVNWFPLQTVEWTIRTAGGDTTVYPGDMAQVHRIAHPHEGDSVEADTLAMRVLLGPDPRDSTDDAMDSIFVHSKYSRGHAREKQFSFKASSPFRGSRPDSGLVYFKALFSDHSWIEVEGAVGFETIVADVTTDDGTRYSVTWDRDGTLISIHEL